VPLYSHSKLSTYETCPRQYKLKYIDRIGPPEGEEGREDLEKFIKQAGMWEQLSILNIRRLEKFIEDQDLDKKIKKGLLQFAEESDKVRVRLVKKREEEE
jgi:hypothetical protein